ncbi:MAG: acyltransferase [Bacteroides sp.]|nr:acyltransferase [Bacteroides sp.]
MKYRRLIALLRGVFRFRIHKNIELNAWKIFLDRFFTLELAKGSKLIFQGKVNISKNCRICVRDGATLKIGAGIFMNDGCQIICRDKISIGNNVQFGQNVLIFDHDHDYKAEGGVAEGKFKCGEIEIGNNVWIGANSVILRNTKIGDNCVIAAGSVIKGSYGDNVLIVQKRDERVCLIETEGKVHDSYI